MIPSISIKTTAFFIFAVLLSSAHASGSGLGKAVVAKLVSTDMASVAMVDCLHPPCGGPVYETAEMVDVDSTDDGKTMAKGDQSIVPKLAHHHTAPPATAPTAAAARKSAPAGSASVIKNAPRFRQILSSASLRANSSAAASAMAPLSGATAATVSSASSSSAAATRAAATSAKSFKSVQWQKVASGRDIDPKSKVTAVAEEVGSKDARRAANASNMTASEAGARRQNGLKIMRSSQHRRARFSQLMEDEAAGRSHPGAVEAEEVGERSEASEAVEAVDVTSNGGINPGVVEADVVKKNHKHAGSSGKQGNSSSVSAPVDHNNHVEGGGVSSVTDVEDNARLIQSMGLKADAEYAEKKRVNMKKRAEAAKTIQVLKAKLQQYELQQNNAESAMKEEISGGSPSAAQMLKTAVQADANTKRAEAIKGLIDTIKALESRLEVIRDKKKLEGVAAPAAVGVKVSDGPTGNTKLDSVRSLFNDVIGMIDRADKAN